LDELTKAIAPVSVDRVDAMKGDTEVVEKIEDAEKLLKELRKALK